LQHQSEALYNIDINDILYNISKRKKRKAAGIDGILNKHIMFCGCHLAVHLCLVFNSILKQAYVPRAFCHGIIIPLLKTRHGDPSKIEMYRGITLSQTLSKLFESCLLSVYEHF